MQTRLPPTPDFFASIFPQHPNTPLPPAPPGPGGVGIILACVKIPNEPHVQLQVIRCALAGPAPPPESPATRRIMVEGPQEEGWECQIPRGFFLGRLVAGRLVFSLSFQGYDPNCMHLSLLRYAFSPF